MSVVDCRGLACPQPVLTTKKPLESQEEAWIFLKESRLPILVSYVKNHERYEMSERPSFGHPSIDEGRNV
jgi:hypothetical protein